MEIIIPEKHKQAIHPVAIFREGWSICWKNLEKLGAIYLIFNLPIMVVYLTPMASKLQKEKVNLATFLCFFLPILIVSIWGHIALLLGAKKAADLEDYTIGQSISQTKVFFLKYLGTVLLATLFFMGVMMLGGLSAVIILALLIKVNKILALLICIALATAALAYFIYFMLRWSLATTVCVLENIRPITALRRSLSLVTDHVHPVVGTYLLIILTYVVCLLPFIIIGSFLGIGNDNIQANRAGTIYSIFINILLVPLWASVTVVLYKKLKEALGDHVHA